MYYFISVVLISILPSGEPFTVRAVTGPFITEYDCYNYQTVIQNIVKQTPTSQMLEAECKELKLKGKQANG
jgi:hypothetical protein